MLGDSSTLRKRSGRSQNTPVPAPETATATAPATASADIKDNGVPYPPKDFILAFSEKFGSGFSFKNYDENDPNWLWYTVNKFEGSLEELRTFQKPWVQFYFSRGTVFFRWNSKKEAEIRQRARTPKEPENFLWISKLFLFLVFILVITLAIRTIILKSLE